MAAESLTTEQERGIRSFRSDVRRSLPTLAVVYLPAALLITAPWTIFVMCLGDALDGGWPGPWNGVIHVAAREDAVSGMTSSVYLAVGILLAAGLVGGYIAMRRALNPVLVIVLGTLELSIGAVVTGILTFL
jgi:hypothetical protein